jgi:transposase
MKESIIIGMDLGDKNCKAVVFSADGREAARAEVATAPGPMGAFLAQYPGATLAIECGTHCRWVAALAQGAGLRALVGNPRKLRVIWQSSRKNDWRDAEMLAKVARTDPSLLAPVRLRTAEMQLLMRLVKARDTLVKCRTAIVNQVRGFCKAEGKALRKCSAEAFARLEADMPPEVAAAAFVLFGQLEEINRGVRRYDGLIKAELARGHAEAAARATQVPGVGDVTAAAFIAAVGDPAAFGDARGAGAFLGLTPRQDQSGGTDRQLRVTKEGNATARRMLVTAANYIMGPFGGDCALRRHGERIAARGGKNARKRAKVAVARKLAVLLLALIRDGTPYRPLPGGGGGAAPA